MANLLINVESAITADTLERNYQRSVSSKYADVQAVSQLLQGVISGNVAGSPPTVTVSIPENTARATGTFILTSAIATDAVSINGVSFTCVASGAGANQFNVGADDDETAENLAASINASVTALVAGYVTAAKTTETASPATVTITSAFPGLAGNQTTIASADVTIVASGARLTGGAVDAGEKVYTF
jgi:hypothetical protein